MTKKEFAAALDSALKAVRKEYGFTQEKNGGGAWDFQKDPCGD